MKTATTPKGWSVELLGLIGAVVFENGHRRLMWSDGRWSIETYTQDGRWLSAPAPGVPSAETMKDARRVGCEFLREFEEVAA